MTVVTEAEIVIDNDVVLDGEGNLTVDGNEDHRVFFVNEGVTAELIGLTVTRGRVRLVDIIESCVGAPGILCHPGNGAGIKNHGALTLTNSTVTECFAPWQGVTTPGARHGGRGGGIHNGLVGIMTLTDSTVSNNVAGGYAGGIDNDGGMTMTNTTVSGSSSEFSGGGIVNHGTLTVTNSTVSGNTARHDGGGIYNVSLTIPGMTAPGMVTVTSTLVDDDCSGIIASGGYNIESPENTCGFDQPTDQVSITLEQLALGPLQDNGGPTMTHALGPGSVAIDVIPDAACEVDEDQRGEPRPETGGTMCDVGAFEVQR
jgi:predicted outer membrane repeat protein